MLDEDVCWQAVRSKTRLATESFLWSCDYWRLLPPFMPIAFATAQERSLLRESESGRERWLRPCLRCRPLATIAKILVGSGFKSFADSLNNTLRSG